MNDQIQNEQVGESFSSSVSSVLTNTYKLLGATLITTAISAFVAEALSFPRIHFLVMLAGFYGLFYLINRNRNSIMGLVYTFALSVLMGVSIGPMLGSALSLEGGSSLVANAFFLTALVFFGLSAYALKTKRDLEFLGGFLFAGFIVLLGSTLIYLFTSIPGLHMAISAGFVLFSSAAILYETNRIVRGGEQNYILAAVSLYVSIYNLFVSLLSLTGMVSKD
jgi:modulator of FtsH protease